MSSSRVAVLGAGIQGCCVALLLARRGISVDLLDRRARPMLGASVQNEGKIHLGLVYASDPSRATHEVLVRGALSFAPVLLELGIAPEMFSQGVRFHYAVPQDSWLAPDEIEAHFDRVSTCLLSFGQSGAEPLSRGHSNRESRYLGRSLGEIYRRLPESEWQRDFDPAQIQAVFETQEEAVDPQQLGVALRRAVSREPRVRFTGGALIEDACIEADDSVRLKIASDGKELCLGRHAMAFNCLWEGRLALDQAVGLEPDRPWLFRFKANVRIIAPELANRRIPSVTLVQGSYGDIVNYGDGRFYVSWYPSFKLAESRARDGRALLGALDGVDRIALARDGIESLSRYVPGVMALMESSGPFEVGGGVIFAWGQSDIDDPNSMLHQRWQIGPQRQGPWVTIDTGKYTTAPLFARQAVSLVDDLLE